jgi:penicillin-binding protein 1A
MTRSRYYSVVALAALMIWGSGLMLRAFLKGLPSYAKLEEYELSLTTRVYDRHGDQVAALSIEKRALLSLAQIPVDLQNAVIATEDSDFFNHWGVSPKGISRAFLTNLRAGRVVQGGSTLTQQLAKLIFLTREKKLIRKMREAVLAVQMERNLSKEEIFQLYLNQIYFGHGAYGVKAAARIYFGKEITELSLAESALLAGMIKYPGGYSPFKHPQRAIARRKVVLRRMVDENFISENERQAALAESIPLERPLQAGIEAPYFVEYLRRKLEPKYGYDKLWRGGLKIHTTLDLRWQKIAEEEMEKALSAFDERAYKEWEKQLDEDIEAGIEPPTVSTVAPPGVQGVFVLFDVKTGAVRTMIGGRGDQFNRAVQAQRQPGSTFKPFIYATALESGMTGTSMVRDEPLAYWYDGRDWRLLAGTTDQYAVQLASAAFGSSEDFRVWVPNNFDSKFKGVITLRHALALSRNMVAVRLIEHIGPPRVVELAHKAGIRSRLPSVLSLGLGSAVISPLELANAFATFANGGIHVDSYSVIRVVDRNDKIIDSYVPKEREAISPQTAYLITHLLQNVVRGGTGRRARVLKRPLAGKTGTTNDNKDLWFVGFSPDLIAVAWMGYDDSTSMGRRIASSNTVLPWWVSIMKRIFEDYPPRDFAVPDNITFKKVDAQTGYLALPTCPRQALQAYIVDTEPNEYCPYDHTQPLDLEPDFNVHATEEELLEPLVIEAEGAEQENPFGLPQLPSDDELESLSEVEY